MKPFYKVILCIIFGLGAFVVGGIFATPSKHMKGKDGYVVPENIELIDKSRMERDYVADVISNLPFYVGLLVFVGSFGYATVTVMRSMKNRHNTDRS